MDESHPPHDNNCHLFTWCIFLYGQRYIVRDIQLMSYKGENKFIPDMVLTLSEKIIVIRFGVHCKSTVHWEHFWGYYQSVILCQVPQYTSKLHGFWQICGYASCHQFLWGCVAGHYFAWSFYLEICINIVCDQSPILWQKLNWWPEYFIDSKYQVSVRNVHKPQKCEGRMDIKKLSSW